MQAPVYNQEGKEVEKIELDPQVFGVKANPAVLHEAVVAKQANARVPRAATKRRGEVRGGGKKPWKQKGTGRARHGSIRSPLWRGGGIVFGPRANRNFAKKINRKVRRAAIRMALSEKAAQGNLFVLTALRVPQAKTKVVAAVLHALPKAGGKTLLALPKSEKAAGRLAANIDRVFPIGTGSLNAADILKYPNLVTTVDGVREMEKIYGIK